jgi:hypothetical protein
MYCEVVLRFDGLLGAVDSVLLDYLLMPILSQQIKKMHRDS